MHPPKEINMAGLSKSRILAHRQCPKRLWLQINKPELIETDDAAQSRMAAGTHVGELARDLQSGGLLIDSDDLGQCLADTEQALASSPRPLFEATFQHDGVLVRADLLLPDEGGYRLAEVKSSARVKENHYEDAAVQAWVARNAGVPLTRIEIAHIDTSFVYPGGGDYRGLFTHADITEDVSTLENDVPGWVEAARTTLAGDEPNIEPDGGCYEPFECPFLAYCQPASEDENEAEGFPPEILPYGKALAASLREDGFNDLRDVPVERLDKPKHQRVWRATVNDKAEIDPMAGRILADLPYPRYYIDFETIQFAIPIWTGTRPYAQIPFQWSCHIELAPGTTLPNFFLADGNTDPRREFADSLLKVLDKSFLTNFLPGFNCDGFSDAGPILVYNQGFECARMRELGIAFPDLAPAFDAAIERVVDLLPITRAYYYHPKMRGSWSLKAVLPTIDPEQSYEGMMVADGGMAQEAFLEMIDPETDPDRKEELRQALLDYCAMDTFSMVRLTQFFVKNKNAKRKNKK
jgi:hypothetical protein